MGRKQTLEVAQQEGLDRLVVALVSRLAVLAPPWAVLLVLAAIGAVSHHYWGTPPAVTWVAVVTTLSTVALAWMTWAVSHHRGPLGRCHSTLSTAAAGGWFTVATITGVTHPFTLAALFFGGLAVGSGWNIRAVIRNTAPGEGGHLDTLAVLFNGAKDKAGLDGANVRTKAIGPHKIQAQLDVPDGKTVDDVQKKIPNLEAVTGVPPGAFQMAADIDDAGKADLTVTDPRIMRRPIPWPGAYAPGASISTALRTGLWQDLDEVQHMIVGHHLQIMGMTGSGKSIGGAWNYLAEIITRYDVAILAADITKGEQSLGPLRPALHRFETTVPGVRAMLNDIEAELKDRTDHLASKGLQKWVEGCGLTYWVLFLEEFPDIHEALGSSLEEKFARIVKAIRSAGGTVVLSLQRSDYSQMPTIVRGQLAKMCFGVAEDKDADFGLTPRQQKRDAAPEQWNNSQQGMAYLDAPGIPDDKAAMPLRTYAWGSTDEDCDRNIRAHAAAWPAAAKDVDASTRRVAPSPGSTAIPAPARPQGAPAGTAVLDKPTTPGDAQEPAGGPHSGADPGVELLAVAAEMVIAEQYASTAMLQRKLKLSHEGCLRLVEGLRRKGVLGGHVHADGRLPVLISVEEVTGAGPGESVLDRIRADGDPVAEYVSTPDPSPELTAGLDDDVPDPTAEEADAVTVPDRGADRPRMGPVESRAALYEWLRMRADSATPRFRAAELRPVWQACGLKRQWAYKVLDEVEAAGVIDQGDDGWEIVAVGILDQLQSGRLPTPSDPDDDAQEDAQEDDEPRVSP